MFCVCRIACVSVSVFSTFSMLNSMLIPCSVCIDIAHTSIMSLVSDH